MKAIIFCLFSLMVTFRGLAQKPFAVVDHIAIYVQNVDSSKAFYSELFHFSVIPNPFPKERVVWIKLGQQLALHMIEGARDTISVPFMHHLCFSVQSLDDFIKDLNSKSINYYSGPEMVRGIKNRADGVRQIFIKDPDRYWVEINDAAH